MIFPVKDDDIMIDARHKDKVLDLLQRIRSRKGYRRKGIGPAVAKGIVERHVAGKIWFGSRSTRERCSSLR